MKVRHCTLQLLTLLLMLLPIYSAGADSNFNPHDFAELDADASIACLGCHKTLPTQDTHPNGQYLIPDMDDYVKSATGMCTDCHGDDSSSHIVGVSPEYRVPADLPLDGEQQITCLTCHYTHGSLHSDSPMASVSFMDRLFNRERLNKSYVLRRNNADGDLCLACHGK